MTERRVSVPQVIDSVGAHYGPDAIVGNPPFVKPLICAGCRVPVKAVTESVRRSPNGGCHTVKAHFALQSRTRHDHFDACPYAFDRRVGEIVTEFAHEVERHGRTFVLLLRQPPAIEHEGGPVALPNPTERIDVSTPHGWRRLRRTIQAASAIVKLLHDFQADPVAQRLFQAKWGDKFIAWSDFCFDASTDAERLVRAVATGADYPLAVHGMVGREAGSALKPGSWVLSLDAGRSSVPVRLRARERAYIDYPRGSRILAYGLWGGWPTSEPYGEVRVWCDSAGSVDTVGFTRTAPGRGGR